MAQGKIQPKLTLFDLQMAAAVVAQARRSPRGAFASVAIFYGVTPVAVTEALQRAEKQLGLVLLERGRGRPTAATEAGAALLRYVKAMFPALTAFQAELAAMRRAAASGDAAVPPVGRGDVREGPGDASDRQDER